MFPFISMLKPTKPNETNQANNNKETQRQELTHVGRRAMCYRNKRGWLSGEQGMEHCIAKDHKSTLLSFKKPSHENVVFQLKFKGRQGKSSLLKTEGNVPPYIKTVYFDVCKRAGAFTQTSLLCFP